MRPLTWRLALPALLLARGEGCLNASRRNFPEKGDITGHTVAIFNHECDDRRGSLRTRFFAAVQDRDKAAAMAEADPQPGAEPAAPVAPTSQDLIAEVRRRHEMNKGSKARSAGTGAGVRRPRAPARQPGRPDAPREQAAGRPAQLPPSRRVR